MNATILPERWSPYLLSVMRIVIGLLFLEHGTAKLLGFPALPGGGAAMSPGMLTFTGTMELFGGALIVIGLFTRPVAFVLSGYMAVAYFVAHLPRNFFPLLNFGEAAVLFCFAFLYLAAAGPGPLSIDKR